MKKELRPHQSEAIKAIIGSLRAGNIPVASCSVGFGKSLVLADLSEKALKQGKRVLQLVPTKELCEQNYIEMFEYTDFKRDVGICCVKLGKYQTKHKCVIATNTSFLSRRAKSGAFDLLLVDECFSGDTLISTPSGLKKIKEVSNNDIVYNAIGTGVVQAVSVKNHNTTYKLSLSNGKEIETTNNHPILTQYGWIKSENLDKRHIVIGLQNLRKLRNSHNATKKKQRSTNKARETSFKRVGVTNKTVYGNAFLLNILLETERECNVGRWRSRENERIIKAHWTQTSNTWRQWQRINRATKTNGRNTRHWVDNGIAHKNKCGASEWCLSELLQGRHWQQGFKNSYRAGRFISQWKTKTVRCEKRQFSKVVRVESVAVEKSGSTTPMYNLQVSGHPSYFAGGVLVHNCHLFSPIYESTYQKIYRSLLRLNPNLKLVGVTGTAYRSHGCITQDSVKGKATFNDLCYESNIPELIHGGFLSKIESISGDISIDLSSVGIKGGDYDTQKMGVKFAEICSDAVKDMRVKFELYNIKTALIFASNIENAEMILAEWDDNATMRIVHGKMTEPERRNAINWIKNGQGKRYIVNVGVLTTGFNHAALDCVVLMRATKSTGLYVQMVGRVLRAYYDKAKGYLIDYGTNIERLGSVDGELKPKTIKKAGDAPTKLCLECETVNPASAKKCKECGAEFVPDPNAAGLYSMRSRAEILRSKWTTHDVDYVMYESVFSKKGDPMLRIDYYDGFGKKIISKFLLLENGGTGGTIAQQFLLKMFKNKHDFYALNASGGLNCNDVSLMLTSAYSEYFKRVVSVTIGEQKDSSKYKELKSIAYENN